MTQDEIIRMAQEAGFKLGTSWYGGVSMLERFAAIVAAYAKSEQIQNAYQQGCEDMRKRMEKRMYSLESQIQLCKTAVADEREACAKVCEKMAPRTVCAAAIRARGNHAGN